MSNTIGSLRVRNARLFLDNPFIAGQRIGQLVVRDGTDDKDKQGWLVYVDCLRCGRKRIAMRFRGEEDARADRRPTCGDFCDVTSGAVGAEA